MMNEDNKIYLNKAETRWFEPGKMKFWLLLPSGNRKLRKACYYSEESGNKYIHYKYCGRRYYTLYKYCDPYLGIPIVIHSKSTKCELVNRMRKVRERKVRDARKQIAEQWAKVYQSED